MSGIFTSLTTQNGNNVPSAHIELAVKLSVARIEILAPQELELETGRLLKILAKAPQGLTKQELVSAFYEDYTRSSSLRQMCLVGCLNKVIQRGRDRFSRFGLTFVFEKKEKRWLLLPQESIAAQRPSVNLSKYAIA